MLKAKVANLIKKIYPEFGLRNDDIILASYPKSGNTWLRFIWTNIISQTELNGREIDFHMINKGPLDAEYDTHSYGELEYKCLPRLVKTHRKYDRRFQQYSKIYLYRNPGDVMISFYEYKKAQINSNIDQLSISEFIRHPKYGMPAWIKHLESWLEKADVVIKYEDMKHDEYEVIKLILDKFNIKGINEDVIHNAIQNSSFSNMRKIEEKKGRPSQEEGKFDKDFRFVRKGNVREYENKLQDTDLQYIRERQRKLRL